MPNWCLNNLRVSGPWRTVKGLVDLVDTGELFEEIGVHSLQDLPVARWTAGGAWEAAFDTPWDPPSRFLRSLSERFRTLRFELEFIEPGNCICGKTVHDHGILQSTTQYPKGSDDYKRLDITCEPDEEEEPCKT